MTSDFKPKNKVCLIVIDGWGIRQESKGNAILNASTPNMDALMKNSIAIEASEINVGLPDGQMGNSEVGHLNIGAGRVLCQDIDRINTQLKTGTIVKNPALVEACERAKTVSGGRIHLVGLCSHGGVHSHIEHIKGIMGVCKKLGVPYCYLHFISDGRDTPPISGVGFVKDIFDHIKSIGYGNMSTLVGRYYAMDRDKNWERTKVAFDAFCYGKGTFMTETTIIDHMKECYTKGDKFTDEFLQPCIFGDGKSRIKENDTIIFLNFRSDRMRQIVTSFGVKLNFDSILPPNLKIFCMTQYDPTFTFDMLFPPISVENVLAQWLAVHKLHQLHVAETEKYAHVTFFFNGGVEKKFDLEDRVLIPSPKVATFDLKPEMSVNEVGEAVIQGIRDGKYSFIVVNLAPPDMVGHTGQYKPTLQACEATDAVIGKIHQECENNGYVLMVTADHGNAEMMLDEHNNCHTAHTCFPVPLIITKGIKLCQPKDRKPALCDVAPTVLDVLGLQKPPQMTGVSLIAHS